jgi:hypothetical protein
MFELRACKLLPCHWIVHRLDNLGRAVEWWITPRRLDGWLDRIKLPAGHALATIVVPQHLMFFPRRYVAE